MNTNKPRMLVVGARGFLGAHLARASAGSFEVWKGEREAAARPGLVVIDITDVASVNAAFDLARPDVVLLLAAISDIDRCEVERDTALAVNVRGAENVANACARVGAKLMFTSSAAIFDGTKHGYIEDDPANPVSFYGETKVRAEAAVLSAVPSAIILRIALAIGFAAMSGTASILDKLARLWAEGSAVEFPAFEYRNPIDPESLSVFTVQLINRGASGVFHIGSSDVITRFELGLNLAQRMGYSWLALPQAEAQKGRAPRGPHHFLLTKKIETFCSMPVPSSEQVIARCFDGAA